MSRRSLEAPVGTQEEAAFVHIGTAAKISIEMGETRPMPESEGEPVRGIYDIREGNALGLDGSWTGKKADPDDEGEESVHDE